MTSTTATPPESDARDRRVPRLAALAVTLVALVVYLLTMNRTFGFIDKGELVAVASTLGIAHPTGYPTIMLLGYLFTKILPMREVLALNAMAALLTAAGAGMMTLLLHDLLGRLGTSPTATAAPVTARKGRGRADARAAGTTRPEVTREPIADPWRSIYAGLAALFTAFTATWWDQGNGFEVYSLHALMMPLVTLLFLRYVDEEIVRSASDTVGSKGAIGFTRRGWLFALALGLSFTNHMTTILLAPAFLVYYFWRLGLRKESFLRLLYLAPGFIVGLLPYLWLPIRASMHPRFNWGNPDTMKRFLDHVSGKQYQVWMFSSSETFAEQSAYFFGNLPAELGYLGVIVALAGAARLFMTNRRLGAFALLLFVACVVYAGGYDIMEIGPYYLTAIFAIGIWGAAGIAWAHERFGSRAAAPLAAALALLALAINYREADESGNRMVEDMTVNVLSSMPSNAVIFSSQWDFWLAGSFYMQGVERMRPDVLVVDPELLRRSWYLDELTHNHPEFMASVAMEVEAFRTEVYKFEHDLPYDPMTIEGAYVGMMDAMIDRQIERRPVFVGAEVRPDLGTRFRRVPYHLTLRLMPQDSGYLPESFPAYRYHPWPGHIDGYTAKVAELYGRSLYARALYEAEFKRDSLALKYLSAAITFDPGYAVRDIPSLPLNSEDQVKGTIAFFEGLRMMHR